MQGSQSNVVRSSYKTGASAQVEPDATETTKFTKPNDAIFRTSLYYEKQFGTVFIMNHKSGGRGILTWLFSFYRMGAADLESQIGDCMIQSSFIQKLTQILPFHAVDDSQQLQQQKQTNQNS